MAINEYDEMREQEEKAAASPSAPAPANEYQGLYDAETTQRRVALQSSVTQAQASTPDRAADVLRLASQTGLPAGVVDRNYDDMHRRDLASQIPYADIQRQSPHVADWIAKPEQAAVSHDDLDKLGFLEWLVDAPIRAVQQGQASLTYGTLRSKSITQSLTPEEQLDLAVAKEQMSAGGELSAKTHWFGKAITGGARLLPLFYGATAASLKGGVIGALSAEVAGAGLSAISEGLAAPFTAAAGFGVGRFVGAAKFGFDQEAGLAYDEFLDSRDELGRTMDPLAAKASALASGVINGSLQAVGTDVLLKSLPGLDKLKGVAARGAIQQALRIPTVRAALVEAMKTYVPTLGKESAIMVGQRAVRILSGELAKHAGGFDLAPGMVAPGNVDLTKQPVVQNADGSVSTVDSVSFNVDGKEVLVPRVTPDGRHLSTEDALAEFQKTGRNMGTFATPDAANAFAQRVHEDYAAGKYQPGTGAFRSARDIGTDLLQTFGDAIQSMALVTLPGPTASFALDVLRARSAEHNVRFFSALGEGVSQSKTQERLPEAMQQFIANATKDGPVEHVYAPIETWTQYWQSEKVDPRDVATEVTGDTQAYDRAIREGTDLQIPTARYATKIAPTEHNKFFARELRLAPLEMNQREAEAFKDRLASIRVDEPPAPGSAEHVKAAVVENLMAAGFNAAQAGQQAELYQAFFGRMASELGIDPMALYARYGLQTSREGLSAALLGQPGDATQPAGAPAEQVGKARTGAPDALPVAPEGGMLPLSGPEGTTPSGTGPADAGRQPDTAAPAGGGAAGDRAPGAGEGGARAIPAGFEDRFHALTADARARGFTGSDDSLAHAFAQRVAEAEAIGREVQSHQAGAEDTGRDLLKAIAHAGGFTISERGGYRGELETLRQTLRNDKGRATNKNLGGNAGLPGIAGIIKRAGGRDPDTVMASVMESPAFRGKWTNLSDFMQDVHEAALVETGVMKRPGQSSIDVENTLDFLGVHEGRDWWADAAQPGDEPPAVEAPIVSRAASAAQFEDVKDSYRNGDLTDAEFVAARDAFKARELNQTLFDTLDTGEVQPRLPGAENVRDQEVKQQPVADLPFALDGGSQSVAEKKAEQQTSLFQTRRGFIRFTPPDASKGETHPQISIALLERADPSTFLHETAHAFLQIFTDVADEIAGRDLETLTVGQRKLLADHGALLQQLGVADDGKITDAQHEQFAEGFERWLMEGKAPSVELQSVFTKFKAWLTGVYRSLKNIGVTLTDETRGIMARMLASDDAIAEAEESGKLSGMFLTADQAGMSPERFAHYQQGIADASDRARNGLEAQLMAEVNREQTAQWREQRKAVKAQVAEGLNDSPVYGALSAMRKGTRPDGTPLIEDTEPAPAKLSRAIVLERYGADRLKALRGLGIITADEGGMDPETIADLFGFSSGDEMLRQVATATPYREAIEQQVESRMLAEHGSILIDGTLADRAKAATANEDRDLVIREEIRALAKQKRATDPLVKTALKEADAERAYERRWFEAEKNLSIAIAKGKAQEEIDGLKATVSRMRAKARGGASSIKAAMPSAETLRDVAEMRVGAMTVRNLQPGRFWSGFTKAGQRAIELAAKQDIDGAIVAKQQQLINLALYREVVRQKAEIETRANWARGLDTPAAQSRLGLAGGGYQEQVNAILARFSFSRTTADEFERRGSLANWAAAQEAAGLPIDLPPGLLDEARRTPYQDMSVDEFTGVVDGLVQIVHLSRLKNKLLKAADDRTFKETTDLVSTSIRALNAKRKAPLEYSVKDEKARQVAGWYAAHTKMATFARIFDGHQDGGAFWEHFIRPLNAAADDETTRKGDAGAAVDQLFADHYTARERGQFGQKIKIAAIGDSLSKEARLVIALNYGTDTNRDRLTSQPGDVRWSDGQVRAILDTLDERDWKFVQGVWNYLNSFWPEIAAKQKRVTGVEPEKVLASVVHTKYGDFEGGYYPIVYDARKSAKGKGHDAAQLADLTKAAAYVRTTTRRGHVEARVAHTDLPLRLEFGGMFRHVEQVIHDLTHHETLIDVTRLLRHPDVSGAIFATHGDQVYEQFTKGLQDIALGSGKPRDGFDQGASWLRKRAQIAGLGYNVMTRLLQPVGVANGMSRVGVKWVAKGAARWMRDAASMESTTKWINEVSPFMRARSTTATADIMEIRSALRQSGGWFDSMVRTVSRDTLTQHDILNSYMWGLDRAQRIADVPTWLGAYEKAMADETNAGDEKRAVALADQAVIDSQGSGHIKDLASVQRGSEAAKLWMTFYSYGNVMFNSTRDVVGKTRWKSAGSVGALVGHLALLYAAPAVIQQAMRDAVGRDDDASLGDFLVSVGGSMLGDALNSVVGVRDLAPAALQAMNLQPMNNRGYGGPAGARAIDIIYQGLQSIGQFEDADASDDPERITKAEKRAVASLTAVAGVLFQFPAMQVQRSVDGAAALSEGKTDNPLALIFGAPKAAKP